MKVRIKKHNSDGLVRLESLGQIKEIIVNEDFIHPRAESVALCFRGKNSSGIIELSTDEIEFITKNIQPKLHLIKDAKVLKFKK